MNPIALALPSVVVALLAFLSEPQINGLCARWANRRIPGSEAYGLLQLKQLGPRCADRGCRCPALEDGLW
jgi:hypothetical protein